MAIQTTYQERLDPARKGMIHGSDYNTVALTCETAAGLAFGVGVSQGAADRGAVIGGQSELFRGITVRDVTLENAQLDKYAQYQGMAVLTRGFIWVAPSAVVAPGGPVYMVPGTGVFTSVSGGNELIQGAAWRSTAAGTGDLALLELSGQKSIAT